MAKVGTKQMVLRALQRCHNRFGEDMWFTYVQIGNMNSSRKKALGELVKEGFVRIRKRPDDARETREAQLVNPKMNIEKYSSS